MPFMDEFFNCSSRPFNCKAPSSRPCSSRSFATLVASASRTAACAESPGLSVTAAFLARFFRGAASPAAPASSGFARFLDALSSPAAASPCGFRRPRLRGALATSPCPESSFGAGSAAASPFGSFAFDSSAASSTTCSLAFRRRVFEAAASGALCAAAQRANKPSRYSRTSSLVLPPQNFMKQSRSIRRPSSWSPPTREGLRANLRLSVRPGMKNPR
mmetsp:Transcript_28698/g.83025  ORF Transcript_28698/g.83025 Transcript_28698/m.83025 type:complete len:217 (-) Transcript_28698:652-1302(-)